MFKDKRILMLGPHPLCGYSGGPSNVINNISKKIAENNNVVIISPIHLQMKKNPIINNNITVYPEPRKPSTFLNILKKAILLGKKFDLVHVHSYKYTFYKRINTNIPIVLTLHGYPTLEAVANKKIKSNSLQFKIIRWIEKKAIKNADAVIAVDKRIYDWIINDLEGDPDKTFHISNATDPLKFNPDINGKIIRDKFNLKNKKVILFFKGLMPKNGPEVIIKAMPYILKKHDDAILLMVGGGYKDIKKMLKDLISKLKLEKDVLLCGPAPHDDAPYYYAAADIVTVPSVHISKVEEATSLTMLEGMATGKPVVASDIGGLKEVIGSKKDKKIGLLFKENNPKDLASKITSLFDDPDRMIEISKNAREFIIQEKTWEINTSKVIEVYNFAIKESKKK